MIFANNQNIQYMGRVDFSEPWTAAFDWPGIQIHSVFTGTSCGVVLSGRCFYDVIIDGTLVSVLETCSQKRNYPIAQDLENKAHTIIVYKRSETNSELCRFFRFILDEGAQLLAPEPFAPRRIEFIGDSHSVGYGNEYPSIECPPDEHEQIYMSSTNTRLAYGPLTAEALGAHYHVTAYSGRGLLRNYNGEMKGKEFLYYYDKTLVSEMNRTGKSPDWDFSGFIPHVVVINLGINDFQKETPYSDPVEFDTVYRSFLNKLRIIYPGVNIVCVASTVTPIVNNMIDRIFSIVQAEKNAGKKDVWYFEYSPSNTALDQHPSLEDHRRIAEDLTKLMKKILDF